MSYPNITHNQECEIRKFLRVCSNYRNFRYCSIKNTTIPKSFDYTDDTLILKISFNKGKISSNIYVTKEIFISGKKIGENELHKLFKL